MSLRGERARAPRPASVRAVVSSVRLGLLLACAAESLLVGLAAALILCAAAAASGLALDAVTGLAVLCGLCAAASWWLEHPVAGERTARELDLRLRHHGALATAYELEGRAQALAPLEELVQARVLARLRLDEAVRALFPPLFVPVAAPAAAALLLFFVREARPAQEPVAIDYGALAGGLEQALAMSTLTSESTGVEGEDQDGGLSGAQATEILAALHARAKLPFQAEDWRRDPAALAAKVDALDAELAALGARVERESELAAHLEAARPWLDALRAALAAEAGPAGASGSPGQAGSSGTAQGTIGGSSPAGTSSTSVPNPSIASEPGPAPLGTQAGTWWPAEYDGLVARWVELSRAERP
ncbi:MAG: hypothetical protein ABL998_22775 [Planctomycetota bacterium]